MVLSREEDTICFLPGLKWTDVMASLCPLNCWYSSGSDMSVTTCGISCRSESSKC